VIVVSNLFCHADVYRNVKQYPSAQLPAHVCAVRVDAPLYFANLQVIRNRIEKYLTIAAKDGRGPIHYVILDMAPVSFVDSTGPSPHAFHAIPCSEHVLALLIECALSATIELNCSPKGGWHPSWDVLYHGR
jgi:MFS superfamily sulfate permease-like transporter